MLLFLSQDMYWLCYSYRFEIKKTGKTFLLIAWVYMSASFLRQPHTLLHLSVCMYAVHLWMAAQNHIFFKKSSKLISHILAVKVQVKY